MTHKIGPEDRPFTDDEANEVYDTLVAQCGAPESVRGNFVYHQTQEGWPNEWRFGGTLGMGGKLWRNDGRVYVNCYLEDNNPARKDAIDRANEVLGLFVKRVFT